MNKNNRIYGGIAILFVAIGAAVAYRQLTPTASENAATSQFFAQTLTDAEGRPQFLSQWKGKPLVVNFWATWCAPCVEEMPELSALQIQLKSKNIQILGIGIDSPSNIKQFSEKYKIAYPLYVGGINASELSRQMGNHAGGLPFTVLIGHDGHIQKTHLGRLQLDELRKELESL